MDIFDMHLEMQRRMGPFSEEEERAIHVAFIKYKDYLWASKLMILMPKYMPFKYKLKSAEYNFELMKKYKEINIDFKGYKIVFSGKSQHVESPLQFEVINKNGVRIATFNFYFLINGSGNGSGLELRINNIQGVKNKENELKMLNEAIGLNWRIAIVKMIKAYTDQNKIKLVGELPRKFSYNKGLYERLLRQYTQTYSKAGVSDIDLENVNVEFKGKVDAKLNTKKRKPRHFE